MLTQKKGLNFYFWVWTNRWLHRRLLLQFSLDSTVYLVSLPDIPPDRKKGNIVWWVGEYRLFETSKFPLIPGLNVMMWRFWPTLVCTLLRATPSASHLILMVSVVSSLPPVNTFHAIQKVASCHFPCMPSNSCTQLGDLYDSVESFTQFVVLLISWTLEADAR